MNSIQFQCPVCRNMTMADLDNWPDLKTFMDAAEKLPPDSNFSV